MVIGKFSLTASNRKFGNYSFSFQEDIQSYNEPNMTSRKVDIKGGANVAALPLCRQTEFPVRAFITNLDYTARFGEVKDFIRETLPLNPMVTIIHDPDTEKSMGAAVVDCKSSQERDDVVKLSGGLIKNRACRIVPDPKNSACKHFVTKNGFSVEFRGKYGQAYIFRGPNDPKVEEKDKQTFGQKYGKRAGGNDEAKNHGQGSDVWKWYVTQISERKPFLIFCYFRPNE